MFIHRNNGALSFYLLDSLSYQYLHIQENEIPKLVERFV